LRRAGIALGVARVGYVAVLGLAFMGGISMSPSELMTSVPLIDLMWNVPAFERDLPLDSMWFQFGVAWVLIAAAVALFGWVEDIAAKRGPRLLP
jgi:hypothetical protein